MRSSLAMRSAGIAGVVGAVLILGGLYLSTTGSGVPDQDAEAASWAAWARSREGPLELGAYVLLFPGLILFLGMFSALAGLLPSDGIWTRMAGYGAVSFFVLFAAGAALASTAASTYGFYKAFDDPAALTVLTGATAGYHFQALAVWSLSLTIVATALALRSSDAISSRTSVSSIGLAALTAAANLIGFGIVFGLIWMVGVGIWLVRWAPRQVSGAL